MTQHKEKKSLLAWQEELPAPTKTWINSCQKKYEILDSPFKGLNRALQEEAWKCLFREWEQRLNI